MAVMMGHLYDALRLAQVPGDAARKAAEEAAEYEHRLQRMKTDLAVLKWLLGIVITLLLIVVFNL